MKSNSHKIIALSLTLMIALSPALSFAKNHENKGNGNREEKSERHEADKSNLRRCFKAFGHLIAPGFIKNKGQVEFPGNCVLPFGIKKKFGGQASSTPDVVAPVISGITALASTSTISVNWNTNEQSTSRLYYGTSTPLDVNATSTNFVESSIPKNSHSLSISNLSTSTQYYIVVESKDASGNRALTPSFGVTTQ